MLPVFEKNRLQIYSQLHLPGYLAGTAVVFVCVTDNNAIRTYVKISLRSLPMSLLTNHRRHSKTPYLTVSHAPVFVNKGVAKRRESAAEVSNQ